MTPKELRLDNWIQLYRKPTDDVKSFHRIKSICSENKTVMLEDGFVVNYESGIEPIPLTEEWLLKFGFENNKEFTYTKNFNAVELYDECIEFFFKPNEEVCIILRQMESDNHNERSHVFIREIMYVHQLQNLYFALTGQELNINL